MANASDLGDLLATFDTGEAGLTVCELTKGVRLAGMKREGVSALQVLSGELWLHVGKDAPYAVQSGSIAFIPAGVPLEIGACSAANASILHGPGTLIRRGGLTVADATRTRKAHTVVAAARIVGSARSFLDRVVIVDVHVSSAGQQAVSLLRQEVRTARSGNAALAVTYMSACVVLGLRQALSEANSSSTAQDRNQLIARAVSHATSAPAELHSIASLAAVAGMSRTTFSRHFTAVMKMTPMAFVWRLRLNEAAAMLRSSKQPVKAISATVGFTSRSHFSRAFRAMFGEDPSQYRASTRAVSERPNEVTD